MLDDDESYIPFFFFFSLQEVKSNIIMRDSIINTKMIGIRNATTSLINTF